MIMFSISCEAAYKLSNMLDEMRVSRDMCVRLNVDGQYALLTVDEPTDRDQVFMLGDRNVLVVDVATCDECAGVRLDCDREGDLAFYYTGNRYEWN